MKLALAVILGLVLPTIVSAQSVEVEGNVASQVDPAKSTVTAAPTSLLANGVATSVVTVTLRNSSSQTLPNIEVTLTSSRGATDTIGHYEGTTLTPGNSYTSDANGVVMFGVRSSTVGSATVTAVAESLVTLSNKPVITFTSLGGEELDPHPDLSSVTADPTEVSANNSALTVITVILRDKAGTVKPGYEVELISDRGATDYIGHFIGTSLVDGNSYITDSDGQVRFGSRSATPGKATYIATVTAIAVELTDKPVVTFVVTGPGGGGEEPPPPPPPPGGEDQPPPTEEEESVIDKVINFIDDIANDVTNKTLAGLGAITTIALFPTLTTSIITALLQNIPFLNFLLTSWLPIKKRKHWGTIRDKKTTAPVAGVEVALWRVGGNEPLAKYRTDQTGQYGFLVEKTGEYFLKVSNPLYYEFQSDMFAVSSLSQIISIDIALVSNEAEQIKQAFKARRYLDWVYYLNIISIVTVSVGTIVSVYVFATEPTTFSGIVLGLYAVIWGVKLNYYLRYRYYGLVVRVTDNIPVKTAIVQLTGVRQGIQALVHSTISDSRGRFLFIVKPAKYSMIVAKEGYEPAEAEVDEKRLAQTIRLQPSANDELLRPPATV